MESRPRVLAITKRVDLSDIAEGWDGAYAIVQVANGAQLIEVSKLKSADLSNEDMLTLEAKTAKENFVSGKVAVLGDNSTPELADMIEDDIDQSFLIAERLYTAIMGVDLDPKGIEKEAASTTASSDDSSSTTTSSQA